MYNVAILGASGMLGSQLSLTFYNSKKFNIYLSSRKSKDLESNNYFFFDASKDQLDIFLNRQLSRPCAMLPVSMTFRFSVICNAAVRWATY